MTLVRTSRVFITTEFIWFHRWPEAPQVRPERSYLASLHRHKFMVRVDISVTGDNREIEFHDLKDNVEAFIGLEQAGGNWPENLSCEMIAERILQWLVGSYPERDLYSVEVSEDGENGSVLQWTFF